MEVLPIVQHLRDLAADPHNRHAIVKDQSSLQSLVLFLDNEDPRVVVTALEALNFLAKHSSNHQAMKNELGMLISLQTIIKNCQGDPKAIELATSVHNKLSSRHAMGSVARRVQLITLQIKGLADESCRQILEGVLVTVPGVISFTFNMARKRCTLHVRSDVKVASLCDIIAKTKIMWAEQVVKKQTGEEVTLSFGAHPPIHPKTKPEHLPDYLPEDEPSPVETSDKAVSRIGGARSQKGSGWLTSVGSFIAKSFYW